MSDALADLYVILRAEAGPMLAAFEEVTAAGEAMASAVRESIASIAAANAELAASATETAEAVSAAEAEQAASATAAAGETTAALGDVIAITEDMSATMVATITELNAQYAALGVGAGASAEEIAAADAEIAAAWETASAKVLAGVAEVEAAYDHMAAQIALDTAAITDADAKAAASTEALAAKADASTGLMSKAFSTPAIAVAGLGAAVAVTSVKMAGDYDQATMRLVTSANEQKSNLDMVRQGMLNMAGQVGYSADELAKAMYKVESGGQHGADGLKVLQAAAEGAKTENADLTTVADAVTTALIDYHLKAGDAATVTSKMVQATASGKMTFEELSKSLSSVAPLASAAHISLDDMLGTLASMTSHGISAQQATQNMADAIRHLQAPTDVQRHEMDLLGINADDLAAKLGERGLSGTMQVLQQAVVKSMPPGSDKVIIDMKNAVANSTPAVQGLADKLMAGSISLKDFTAQAKALDPVSGKQALEFATLAGQTHRLGSENMTGAQALQTYGGAMQKAMGDATGLKVALMTTGENADYTNQAIDRIKGTTTEAGGHVKGWSDIQGEFNTRMAQAKDGLGAMAISIGEKLLPVATKIVGVIADGAHWMSEHQAVAVTLASVIGGILALAFAALATKAALAFGNLIKGFAQTLASAARWALTKIGILKRVETAVAEEAEAEVAAEEKGGIRKVAAAVGNGAKWLAVKVADGAKAVASATANGAKVAASWAASQARMIASAAADGAKWLATTIASWVKAAAEATVNGAKVAASWVATQARMAASAAADGARWLATTTANFVKASAAAATNAARTTASWVAANARMVADSLAQGAKWLAGLIAKFVAASASAVVQAAVTAGAWVAANIAMIAATGGILLVIAAVIAIGIFLVKHWDDVKAAAQAVWEWIKNLFKTVWDAIVSAIGAAVDFIKGIFDWFGTLPGKFGEWFSNVFNAISDWIGKALDFIKSIPGRILSALGSLGSLLLNAGKDLITGLWNGITSMAGWLWDKILGFIKAVVPGPILSFLGIQSPSRWMRDEVGQHIPTGLAAGIDSTASAATESATNLAKGVAKATQDGLLTGSTTATNLATATRGGDGASIADMAAAVTSNTLGGADLAVTAGVAAGTSRAELTGLLPGQQAGGTTINLAPVVQGNVWTTKDLVTELQQELIRHGIRNTQNGTNYLGLGG